MFIKRRWAVALVVALLLGSGVFFFRSLIFGSVFGSEYEEPSHEVVLKDGNIEIRKYEPYVVAEITIAGSFDRATRTSFNPLFNYISGSNRSRQNIDMTTPVLAEPSGRPDAVQLAMTIPVLVEPRASEEDRSGPGLAGDDISAWTMAFVLPAGYTAETAPLPANESVIIRQVEVLQPRRRAPAGRTGRVVAGARTRTPRRLENSDLRSAFHAAVVSPQRGVSLVALKSGRGAGGSTNLQ